MMNSASVLFNSFSPSSSQVNVLLVYMSIRRRYRLVPKLRASTPLTNEGVAAISLRIFATDRYSLSLCVCTTCVSSVAATVAESTLLVQGTIVVIAAQRAFKAHALDGVLVIGAERKKTKVHAQVYRKTRHCC